MTKSDDVKNAVHAQSHHQRQILAPAYGLHHSKSPQTIISSPNFSYYRNSITRLIQAFKNNHHCHLDTKHFTDFSNKSTHTAMDMQGTPIGSTNQGMKVRQSSRMLSSWGPNLFLILMLTRSPRTHQTPNAIRTQRARARVL